MQPPRLRKFGPGCLGLLLAIGLVLWVAKDLPRRTVVSVLSDRLGARVHLDRLETLGTDKYRLVGLSMASFRDYPFIETLRLGEVEIEGSIRGVLGNRFDRVRLRGVEARLAPAPAVIPPDRPLPEIGELVLESTSIRIAAGPGGDDLRLCLTAIVRDVGKRAHGAAWLSAANLDFGALYALAGTAAEPLVEGRLEDLEANLSFGPEGGELSASAESALLAGSGATFELSRPRFRADRFGSVTEIRLDADHAAAKLGTRLATVDKPSAEATVTAAPDGMLRIGLIPRLAWLAAGRLEADWDQAGERLHRLEARLHGLDLKRLWPDSGLDATADVEIRGAGDHLDYSLEIAPEGFIMAEDRQLRDLRGSMVRLAGSLPFEPLARLQPVWAGPFEATIAVPRGQGHWGSLTLPPTVLPLSGSFNGKWLGGEEHRLSGSLRIESPAAGRLVAGGELTASGDQANADLDWSWTGIDLESISGLLRHLSMPVPDLKGSGDAKGKLSGPIGPGARDESGAPDGPAVRGELRMRQLDASSENGDYRLSAGKATASWSWSGGEAPIELLEMEASGTFTAPELEPLALTMEASGTLAYDLTQGRLESTLRESTELRPDPSQPTSGLGTAYLSGHWRRRPRRLTDTELPIEVTAGLSLDALDLAHWQRVAKPPATTGTLAGYQLAGVAGADLQGTWSGGTWQLAGPVRLESAGFTSLDGSQVTEGLDSRLDLSVRGAPSSAIEALGTGRFGGFLLLWNTFFGDFSEIEASLSARASIEPTAESREQGGPRRWRLEVGGSLPGGPLAETTFESSGDGLRYTLSLDDRDLGATHRRYLAPLLEEQLGRLELGGALAVRGRGSYRAADSDSPLSWSLIGGARLTDLYLSSGGGQFAIAGLDLDLPFDLRRRPSSALDFSGPSLAGRLAFDRLAVRDLEVPPTVSDLLVEADSVGLEKPIALAVLGGAVTFERLTLRHLLRPGRHLESGIELSDIRLEKISDELELIPLEGALNGHLTGVRLSPSMLAVEGGGEIEVFGGTVKVRDISGQDVLSKYPKLKLSADFSDIDLGALTRRLDFGEMTGTLEGTLEDCELFRGVPVRFSARLETVHREGVPRTVDVKAVNNITILGTGQRTSIFDRGVQRFFDRYTYERLGVTMRLDKDVLLLHGLEQRGNKELFLRGRLPLRIDVVNAQPGKTVSFQTMVGRLRSLDFAGATTEP